LWIGSFIGGGSDFDGDIDFIRISSGALTPAQFVQTTVALQPIAETLRPANGAKNVSPWSPAEAEFQNRDTAVVLSSLKLFIDGTEVTSASARTVTSTNTEKSVLFPCRRWPMALISRQPFSTIPPRQRMREQIPGASRT